MTHSVSGGGTPSPGYKLPDRSSHSDDRFAIRKLTSVRTLLDDRLVSTAAVLATTAHRQGKPKPPPQRTLRAHPLNRRQALIQIRDQVLDAFQADGEADDVGARPGGDELFLGELAVGGGRRVQNQRAHVPGNFR